MASPNVVALYAGSKIHPLKEKRSTCRHFKEGKCVFWQTPDMCNFPHRPRHAPRPPLPVETSNLAQPVDGTPPLHSLKPLGPQLATYLVAHTLAQVPAISPNSDDGRHAWYGDEPQYLSYHLNNTAPNGQVNFQPCHRLVPSPPGFPFAEPRPVRVEYYPGHGIYYHSPPVPSQGGVPYSYTLYTPPDSVPDSPTGLSPSTCFPPLSSDGYSAAPFAEWEEGPLVDPEKLRRERSKICWYGEDCKRPNCYYRHDVTEDEAEDEFLNSVFTARSVPTDVSPNATSQKDKEKSTAGRAERSSDSESSTKDGASRMKPSDNRGRNAFTRAPLVVDGTNCRRRDEDIAA
ncbi:uncharacterized protein ColSpa_09080 [Colletotrichum spaethianum]|uniref:C3H1-type domain-containing protein n=1 Tax=Colletotrichum spaethianum TaxID=700344 RepID=A0AA37UJ00_9PEZI|nr:uncharacterized protein ColSpa_09080 [Colletotrichum spaethianum]GKT48899.1 hypothetical protein ColSpa_09080 [Colletotrichum spaethianum]